MTDHPYDRAWDDDNPDAEPDDDIAYEPFEDVTWTGDDDLDIIDLDALDELGEDAPDQAEQTPGASDQAAPHRHPGRQPSPHPPTPRQPTAPAHYRVLLPLPAALAGDVAALRAEAGIDERTPPGILLAEVRTTNRAALVRILDDWSARFLPVTVEIDEVLAEVISAQQYAAAWTVQPADRLLAARRALLQALADSDAIAADPTPVLDVRVTIATQAPAQAYPHLLGAMQAAFKPATWNIASVQVFQAPPPDSGTEWLPIWDSRTSGAAN